MFRTDAADNTGSKPAYTALGTPGYHKGTPSGTVYSHEMANHVQEELCAIVEQVGGATLDKSDDNQIAPIVSHVRGLRSSTTDTTSQTTPDGFVIVAAETCDVGGGGTSAVIASKNSDCIGGGSGIERACIATELSTIGANATGCLAAAGNQFDITTAAIAAAAIAGAGGQVSGTYAASLATDSAVVSGTQAAAIGSDTVSAAGVSVAIIGSEGQNAADLLNNGLHGAIIASYGSATAQTRIVSGANEAAIMACRDAEIGATSDKCVIVASEDVDTTAADQSAAMASKAVDLTQCTESAVIAAEGVTVNTTNGAILVAACDFSGAAATIGGTTNASAMIACLDDASNAPDVSGQACAAIACKGNVDVSGTPAAAIACDTGAGTGPSVSGNKSAALCSDGQFSAAAANSMIVCSSWGATGITLNAGADANAVIFGDTGGGGIGASLRTMRQQAIVTGGNSILADGAFAGTGLDYAEMFENAKPGVLPICSILSHTGGKARLAQPGDRVLGIVSVNPSVLGGAAGLHWEGIIERDEFGQAKLDKNGKRIVSDKLDLKRYESGEYLQRSERPEEWTKVGLTGQLRVRVDDTVGPGSFVVPGKDGIGTHADEPPRTGRPIECFRITAKATKKRGCAVALCLVG